MPYPILADYYPHGRVAQLYGLFNDTGGTFDRAVVIIDKQGIVRFVQTYASAADLKVADILAEVERLK